MNTSQSTTNDWPNIRLLLRDYLQRRHRRMFLMVVLYMLGALVWILVNQLGPEMDGLRWVMLIFVLIFGTDLPNRGRGAHHPDAKVIRSLPITEDGAALAVWLQYVGIPLFLCVASGLLALLAGVFSLTSVQSAAGGFAAYVAVVAFFQSLRVGILSPVLCLFERLAEAGKTFWAAATGIAGPLVVTAFMFCAIMWMLRETGTARLVGITAPCALVLLCSSFHFRRYLVMDPRMLKSAALPQPSAPKQAAFAPRRLQDRCYPLVAAAKAGLALAAITAAIAAGLCAQRTHTDENAGFFLILLVVVSVVGCTGGILPWLSTLRACRALPIPRKHLALGVMAVQVLAMLPSLLALGCGAWCFSMLRGGGVSGLTAFWMGLTVETLVLFFYPHAVRSGGASFMQFVTLSVALVGGAAMWLRILAPAPHVMLLLAGLGLAMLAVALVFCYLRLRTFIANDSRVYQKHTSVLYGQEM